MPRIPARARHITQEPQLIDPGLLGHSLATFRRRMAAFFLDVFLFGVIGFLLFTGLTAWSFHREDPTLYSRIKAISNAEETVSEPDRDRVLADLCFMILERCPEAFPRDLATKVRQKDMSGLTEFFDNVDSTVGFGQGKTRTIENADGTNQMVIGLDLVMGGMSSVFGWGGLFVGWFTFWSFVSKGRSPGKALFRIRVVRLEGGNLRLWDCFSRAGGYSASTATLLLGFLEAVWHPNRQAIHDRIAGTVVVRG